VNQRTDCSRYNDEQSDAPADHRRASPRGAAALPPKRERSIHHEDEQEQRTQFHNPHPMARNALRHHPHPVGEKLNLLQRGNLSVIQVRLKDEIQDEAYQPDAHRRASEPPSRRTEMQTHESHYAGHHHK